MRPSVWAAAILLVSLVSPAPVCRAAGDPLAALSHREKLFGLAAWQTDVWAVGFPGLALHGQPGGTGWKRVDLPVPTALFALQGFGDARAVACGAGGAIVTTSDGGGNWTRVESPTSNPLFDLATVPGTQHAWAVGHFATILHSQDGGASWQPQTYPLPEDAEDEPGLNAVDFVDPQIGWAAGEFGVIIRTDDGGVRWTQQTSGVSEPLYDLSFVDALRGVAVGSGGTVLVTVDGGATWSRRESGTGRHLFGLHFDGGTIVAVGQDGIVVRGPFEGSAGLAAQRADVFTWLSAVVFTDGRTGIAVGGRGTVLTTADGGASWTSVAGR